MANFFEKLKKGMGIEAPIEEGFEEKEVKIEIPKKTRIKKIAKEKPAPIIQIKKLEIKAGELEDVEKESVPLKEIKMKEEKIIEKTSPASLKSEAIEESKEKWATFSEATVGQLAIDIYQTDNDLVIQSAIAGVKPESLDVTIEKDIVIIKGIREKPFEESGDYFAQECYWGPFSREVILPAEADPARVIAEMKDGILTIRIPKIQREKKRKIEVKGS